MLARNAVTKNGKYGSGVNNPSKHLMMHTISVSNCGYRYVCTTIAKMAVEQTLSRSLFDMVCL